MMSIVAARVDVARFGFEAFRASPRQADLLILSGRVSIKMAPVVRRIYDQMLEPKWAIAMGACSSSMGVFNNYAIVPADKFMPVDVHVPGCPPRPEALMHGILKLRAMIQDDPSLGWRERYDAVGTEELVPDAPSDSPAVNVYPPGRHRGCLTRPGLELLAQELREQRRRRASSTPCYFRGKAALHVEPGRDARDAAQFLREQGLRRSWPACTASTTTPRSRASACTTSCSTWTTLDRITVKLRVADRRAATCESVTPDWPTADHQEREVYDMFGVVFDGHPDLRRILMPEDYEGHPAAPRLPDRRRAGPLHLRRARSGRGLHVSDRRERLRRTDYRAMEESHRRHRPASSGRAATASSRSC